MAFLNTFKEFNFVPRLQGDVGLFPGRASTLVTPLALHFALKSSGPNAVYLNVENRLDRFLYLMFTGIDPNLESYHLLINNLGFNSNLKQDLNSVIEIYSMRVEGRCLFKPLGYFDQRAIDEGESRLNVIKWQSPRDLFGMAYINNTYDDPDKQHLNMMYIPAIRRVRRMSGTDVQDPLGGQDMCADDGDLFNQKLSKERYRYEYKVLEEREYLVPFATDDGQGYIASEGLEWRDYEFERRPMVVVELIQTDSNYIYSKRVLYFDRELQVLHFAANYDQKGRLYRTLLTRRYHQPESGISYMNDTIYLDHIDLHTTLQRSYILVGPSVDRGDFSLKKLIRTK